ncbi:MAG: hypothetical protein Q8N47_19080 [Bryobacterales bacterium]|nr:hypothetical protein [Bryobacterales bacterium]
MAHRNADTDKEAGQKKVLVGVRVPESFQRRIQSECLRRDLSLQEMVVDALKLYFRTPLEWDYATTTYVRHGEEEGQPLAEEEVARRNSWIGLWAKYVNAMPEEKIEVLTRAMEWDLLAQKSSQRKSIRQKPQPSKRKEQ